MFNSPRPAQRYPSSSGNGLAGSFDGQNPLASSSYDGLDPWSASHTPEPLPPPAPSGFSSVIGDAVVPPIYNKAFNAVDPANSGEISVNALSRVLGTSSLPASTIERIVNLVSSRPRVSRLEFFVALALVAQAQSGQNLSIEQVASLSSQNALPVPNLNLSGLAMATTDTAAPAYYSHDSVDPAATRPPIRSPAPAYSSEDPWMIHASRGFGTNSLSNGASSSLGGSGLPKDWWKRQEKVNVSLLGPQGFILNRYMTYEVMSERGSAVTRRYSEFVFLWECLVKRYPFRILPQLPPKRIGSDDTFLEQRRKGLVRFLNFVVNHPIIKEDGVLAVFLTEPNLEAWRKHTTVSLDEESISKRIDPVEEMSIPSDLEDKLNVVRSKIGQLIEQWQKICLLAERLIKRREAAAVRNPNAMFRRTFASTHLKPSVSTLSPPSSPTSTTSSLPASLSASILPNFSTNSIAESFFGSLTGAPLIGSGRPDGAADGGFTLSRWADPQADMSRLTITLNTLNEVNAKCWRGDDCELCTGVREGVQQMSGHMQSQADESERRTQHMMATTLEALKSQRDLYIAVRDLFIRHHRLAGDSVDQLRKRIEGNTIRIQTVQAAGKENWEAERDRLQSMIERDNASIQAMLRRRVFVRHCMWHEIRVVLHNRENTLLTQAVQAFARDETVFAESSTSRLHELSDALENMPYE